MRPEVISSLVHCGHSGGIKRLEKYHLKISEIVTLQFSLFVFFYLEKQLLILMSTDKQVHYLDVSYFLLQFIFKLNILNEILK